MRILSRYLLREHFGPFLFAGVALTGLLILNQVALRLANLIGKGLSAGIIFSVFGLSLPFIIAMTIPMAVLVAVLHAFSRLGADSEVTALKASGVNLVALVRPVVAVAVLLAAAEFVFVDQVLPRSNHRLKNLLVDIARKKPTFELVEQSVNEVVPGKLFLRAGRIDQAADRMRDVVIYDLANPNRRRTIYADSGYIRFNATQTDLFLTLFDGHIHDYDREQAGSFRRIFFATDLVRVSGVSNQLQRTNDNEFRGDREMGLCEMEARVARNQRTIVGTAAEERRARERDALALVGVSAVATDTAAPRTRRSVTSYYCTLLGGIAAVVAPGTDSAGGERRGQLGGTPSFTGGPSVIGNRGAGAEGPVTQGGQRMTIVGDPTGQQLRGTLGGLANQRGAALLDAAGFQVEIYKKYSLAVACLVFVLVGVPVALRFPRGGMGLVIGASCIIFGVYYIGLIGGEALADKRVVAPFPAMWGPNIMMALIGLVMFLRLNREQATVRGGGLRLPRLFRRRRRPA